MDYFKIFFILVLFSTALFSFSQKPTNVDKSDYALLKEVTDSCHQEIKSSIKDMLGISAKISKKPFTQSSYVDITNSSQKYFQFLLHKSDGGCFISRVTDSSSIIKTKKLKNCKCR